MYDGNSLHGTKKVKGINRSNQDTPLYCEKCGSILPRPWVYDAKEDTYRIMKGYTSAYKRMSWDQPASTLTQNFQYACSDNKLHPTQNRVLSIYEALILQTINDYDFEFKINDKVVSTSLIRDSIGESVPPKIIDLVCKNMGKQYRKIGGGIFGFLSAYLFLCMIIGLLGFESPVTYLYVPLALGLSTFILIHATAAFYNRKQYFQRYVDPVWAFLPINLLSMWAPLLSISLRLFGNGIAGYVVLKLVYWAFENITIGVVSLAPAAVVVTPILHAYFDIVSGFIQTMVYTLLSMALIKNEVPEDISTKLDKEYEQEVARINKILDSETK